MRARKLVLTYLARELKSARRELTCVTIAKKWRERKPTQAPQQEQTTRTGTVLHTLVADVCEHALAESFVAARVPLVRACGCICAPAANVLAYHPITARTSAKSQ
eukprot:1159670-Pelagomonas_calceolata.AAC.12